MDFENLEKNIRSFYSKFGSRANFEEIEKVILRKADFKVLEQDRFLRFINKPGKLSLPTRPCSELEFEVYHALKEKKELPLECQNCKQIFVHPEKDETSHLVVLSALTKAFKEANLPIVGRTPKSLQKEWPMKERIALHTFNAKDFMEVLHYVYLTLKGAHTYSDAKEIPEFTIHFLPKQDTMIYARHGCGTIRGLAKQLKCLNHYFNSSNTMYQKVPLEQSGIE